MHHVKIVPVGHFIIIIINRLSGMTSNTSHSHKTGTRSMRDWRRTCTFIYSLFAMIWMHHPGEGY